MSMNVWLQLVAIMGTVLCSTWYISARIEEIRTMTKMLKERADDHYQDDDNRFKRLDERLDEAFRGLNDVARDHLNARSLRNPDGVAG